MGVGLVGVYGASRRFHLIRHLTLPMKAFLVTSTGTFAAIIAADRSSRSFQSAQHPEEQYREAYHRQRLELEANKSSYDRAMDWGRENRYSIVGASWLASMATALGLVSRNKYLTGAQKLVQARVYAQGLTLAVLIATAAFEIGDRKKGVSRWKTVRMIDPNDPEHKKIIEKKVHQESYEGEDQWRGKWNEPRNDLSQLTEIDMIEAEERKLKARKEAVEKLHEQHAHKAPKDAHVEASNKSKN